MQNKLGLEFKTFLYSISAILMACIGIAIYFESILPIAVPIVILGAYVLFLDFRFIYYLLIFSIPISIHLMFGSSALDVASEPLMILLVGISPIILILKLKEFKFITHPIILILLVQFLWAIIATQFSVNPVLSYKFLLAKLWFLIPFILLGTLIICKPSQFKIVFWLYFISLTIVCIYTTINHCLAGLTFESSNFVMQPFFHNHVDYSATIASFIPFCWFARYWYSENSFKRKTLTLGFVFLAITIGISYTRASWLAFLLLLPAYYAIKLKLTKLGLILGSFALIGALYFLNHQNKYLDYSIEYEKVVFNRGDIGGHLQATYQMEDVSGMERIYRWVAAKNMILDNFWTGTGPNTFYPEYMKYTVNSFETYVSDNPEQSTSHNYFILLFSEQGVVGFIILTVLYCYLLIKGTNLTSKFNDTKCNNLAMATTLSLVMLLLHLFLNDLIETDKIGSLFYIYCALLIRLDLWPSDIEFQPIKQDI